MLKNCLKRKAQHLWKNVFNEVASFKNNYSASGLSFPFRAGHCERKSKIMLYSQINVKKEEIGVKRLEVLLYFEWTFSMKQKFPIDWLRVNVSPTKNNFIIRSLKVCIKTCALVSKCMLPLFHTIKIAVWDYLTVSGKLWDHSVTVGLTSHSLQRQIQSLGMIFFKSEMQATRKKHLCSQGAKKVSFS